MSWQPKTNEWYISQLRKEQNKMRDFVFKNAKVNTQGINLGGLGGKSGSTSGTSTFRPTLQIVTRKSDSQTTSTWDRIKASTTCIKVQEAGTNTNGSNRDPSTTNPTVKWIDGVKQDGQILILTPKEGKTLTLERYGNIDLDSNITVNDNQFVYLQWYADKKTYDGSSNLISTGAFAVMNTSTTVSGGASQTLNNLTDPTAVNQDLLPDNTAGSTPDRSLGSATKVWADAYIKNVYNTDTIKTPSSDHTMQFVTGGGQRLAVSDNSTTAAGYVELFGAIAGSGDTQTKPEFKTVSTDASPANNDMIGGYAFDGFNAATSRVTYSRIDARSVVITNGAEVGDLRVFLRDGGGNLDPMFEVNHIGILLPTSNHATPSTDGSIYKDSSGNVMVRTGGATKSLSTVGTATVSKLDDVGDCTIGSTISANTVLKEYNGGWVDGLIGNDQVASNAAIVTSKLAITNSDFSGVFGSITGIGTQAQTLNMNANNIESVEHLILGVALSAPITHGSIYAGASEVYIRAGSTTYPIAAKLNSIPATLDDLSDTSIGGTPSANTVLKWSGSAWVDGNVLDANIDGTITWAKINKSGSVLDDIGDCVIGSTPSNNTVLKYVSGTGWVDGNVENVNIDAGADIAQSKMADVTNMRVLGNTSGSSTTPQEVTIYDEDNMSSNSNTGIATQQSIKAYVTSQVGGATTELDNLGTTSINADLIPQSGKDLGTSSNQWTDLWVTGVAYLDAIGFGTTAMTLPTSDGSANYVLKTAGNGNLDWASVSGASTSFVGFSADNDLTMNTYNIDGLDQLIFSTATSTTSPTWNDSNIGMEASSVGLYFNVPSNDYFTFNIDGDTEFSISASTISASSKRITYVTDPSGAQDAATKNYVDNNSSSFNGTCSFDLLPSGTRKVGSSSNEFQYVYCTYLKLAGGTSKKIDTGGGDIELDGGDIEGVDDIIMNGSGSNINMNGGEIDNVDDISQQSNGICNFSTTNVSGTLSASGTANFHSTVNLNGTNTYAGNSTSDYLRIKSRIDFTGNYVSSSHSIPSTVSGYISVRINGQQGYKIPYYS